MELVTEVQLVPVSQVSLAQRVKIMNAAYADYYVPVHMTEEQVAQIDLYYDVDIMRSVVARTHWELVGIALLARREERGWVTGVGVMPGWRRKGIARLMMEYLLREAEECGVRRLTLEVITENSAAYSLYCSLGFREHRKLVSWQRPVAAAPLPLPAEHLIPVSATELLTDYAEWHDLSSSWQCETSTLRKMTEHLRGYRLDWKGHPTAYCLVQETIGGVILHDIGVNPDAGLLMPARVVLQSLAALYLDQPMVIMNVPADNPLNRILHTLDFRTTVRQIEMVLDLTKT